MSKNPLDFGFEELQTVIRTGKWPEGSDLTAIFMEPKFAGLIRNPTSLARKLLKLHEQKMKEVNKEIKKEEKKLVKEKQPVKEKPFKEKQPVKYIPNPKTLELKEKALSLKERKIRLDESKQLKQLDLYLLVEKMNRNVSILRKELNETNTKLDNLIKGGLKCLKV